MWRHEIGEALLAIDGTMPAFMKWLFPDGFTNHQSVKGARGSTTGTELPGNMAYILLDCLISDLVLEALDIIP